MVSHLAGKAQPEDRGKSMNRNPKTKDNDPRKSKPQNLF